MKVCGIVSLMTGGMLLLLGVSLPFLVSYTTIQVAKKAAALQKETENTWKGIPGGLDIEADRYSYVYNCTNKDDVIYKGAKPIVREFGPYIYRKYDVYSEIDDWEKTMEIPGKPSIERNAVSMVYDPLNYYNETMTRQLTEDVDFHKTKIWQINQAGHGYWAGQTSTEEWRLYINLLYSVVIDGLGRQVAVQGAWSFMQQMVITSNASVSSHLFSNTQITEEQQLALFYDPNFGLSNVTNYVRWDPLVYDRDPVSRQLLINELQIHFNLTWEQVSELQQQWNMYFEKAIQFLPLGLPSKYPNFQGVAYWQWASSMITGNMSTPNQTDSVVQSVDTVSGYPEISYFKIAKLIPAIIDNTELFLRFKGVELYVNRSNNAVNYEDLFNLTSADGGDPLETSLFNISTLKALLKAGGRSIDIIKHPDIKPELLNLSIFQEVTELLNLEYNEQTYLIYLWLVYAKIETYERKNDTSDPLVGTISNLGQTAIPQALQKMEQEFPVLIYTYQFQSILNQSQTCTEFYEISFGFSMNLARSLCEVNTFNISTFNFQDPLKTCKAWINLYFNNETYEPSNYADLAFLSMLSYRELNSLIQSNASLVHQFIRKNVMKPIYEKYQDKCIYGKSESICTNKELTYIQWINQGILKNAPASLKNTSESYQRAYPEFSKLTYTPELGYFLDKAELNHFQVSVTEAYEFLQPNRLFNLQIIGDIILNKETSTYSHTFTNEQTARYLKFIIIEEGLQGFFKSLSPQELLEGFTDPLLHQLSQMPVYKGGDQLTNPFLSICYPPTTPLNNSISVFTGKDDYMITRRYAEWLGRPYATMKKQDYVSMHEVKEIEFEIWAEREYITGTDGIQFHPNIQETEKLATWFIDDYRNEQLLYRNSDTLTYSGLEMMNFDADYDQLLDKYDNPENGKYYTEIGGTTNVTKIFSAPSVASKGHFYRISEKAKDKTAIMVDKDNQPIQPNYEKDETWRGIEQISGACLEARQRIQISFQVAKDTLFSYLQNDYYLVPDTFISGEFYMQQSTVKTIFADVLLAKKVKIYGTLVIVIIALALIGLGIFFILRYRRLSYNQRIREEEKEREQQEIEDEKRLAELEKQQYFKFENVNLLDSTQAASLLPKNSKSKQSAVQQ